MPTRRVWITAAAALGVVLVGAVAAAPAAIARGRVAEPNFQVVEDRGAYEVRRYEPRLVAEVRVEGSAKQASSAGFRILADFIFGNNTAQTKVAMTAPVDQTASAEAIDMTAPVDQTAADGGLGKQWVIAFTMPATYTLETLPKPNDARVSIREIPAKTYAVMRFSGTPARAEVDSKIASFVTTVADAGLEPTGATPRYARYDPPWTPGFMRRNEIFVELNPSPAG